MKKYCVAFSYLDYCYGKDKNKQTSFIDLFTLKQARGYVKKHSIKEDLKVYKLVKIKQKR